MSTSQSIFLTTRTNDRDYEDDIACEMLTGFSTITELAVLFTYIETHDLTISLLSILHRLVLTRRFNASLRSTRKEDEDKQFQKRTTY